MLLGIRCISYISKKQQSGHSKALLSGSGGMGWRETLLFIFAGRHPLLFNPSLQNTEILNQGPALLFWLLLYRRKSGRSAKPQGTRSSHWHPFSVWNQRVIVCALLLICWNRNQRSQGKVMGATALYLLWPRRVLRCLVSRISFQSFHQSKRFPQALGR